MIISGNSCCFGQTQSVTASSICGLNPRSVQVHRDLPLSTDVQVWGSQSFSLCFLKQILVDFEAFSGLLSWFPLYPLGRLQDVWVQAGILPRVCAAGFNKSRADFLPHVEQLGLNSCYCPVFSLDTSPHCPNRTLFQTVTNVCVGWFELWHSSSSRNSSPHSCIGSATSSGVVTFDAKVRGQQLRQPCFVAELQSREHWSAGVMSNGISNQKMVKRCSKTSLWSFINNQ